jgi:D-alanine-D-alanine ligase
MKVAIIYNKDLSGVINKFGMQNKEKYNPKTVRLVAAALEQGGHNVAAIDGTMDVIQQLQDFMQQALVEQFIRGREFCVGLLGNNPPEAFPIIEIDLEGNPDAIQSVTDKKKKPREKICPAPVSKELGDRMVDYTVKAFNALQLRDFARVDIRMDENENIYLLEINSMASLGRTGAYVNSATVAGYDYGALINRILDVAVVRYFSGTTLINKMEEVKDFSSKLPLPVRIRTYIRSRNDTIDFCRTSHHHFTGISRGL